jgi:DNA-binding NarL/FixJ family response regulator
MSDWVSLIESGYSLDGDLRSWLDGVIDVAAPLLDAGPGVAACVYRLSMRDVEFDPLATRSEDPRFEPLVRAVMSTAGVEGMRKLFAGPALAGTMSRKVFTTHPDERRKLLEQSGGRMQDLFGLIAPTGTGHGVFISAALREPRWPTHAEVVRYSRVAAHLGAGLRLRLALAQRSDPNDDPLTEAVLDPSARIHDAQGVAQGERARETLREAVRLRERARTTGTRSRADEALTLWEGLVAGRWSLVDRFESDGKRFIVARKNDPEVGDPRGLSQRERQVLEFLGLGRSLKEIAYALGISQSAVSNSVQRATAKLGMRSRAELAAFFAPDGLRAQLVEMELAGEPLVIGASPLADEAQLAALSNAEREVALDLLRGWTGAGIAARRGTSPTTVTAQVQAIYTKLGVGSRVELAAKLSAAARSPEDTPE